MSKKPTAVANEIQITERSGISIKESAGNVVSRIVATAQTIHFNLPDTVEELERDAIEAENRNAIADAQQGLRFLAIKEQRGHGHFIGWLEANGFAPQRVQEKMKIAHMLLEAQESTAAKLVNLGTSKLMTLAKLPIETIEDAASKGELDEIDEMSVRELKAYARKMENRAVNAETDLETKIEMNKMLIKQRDQALPQTEFPEFVTVIRHESQALAQKGLLCVDSLEQMLDEHMILLSGGGKSKEWHKGSNIAITTMYLQVQNLAARAASLVLRMRAELSTDTFDTQSVELRFNASEIEAARKDYELMVMAHNTEKAARAFERELAKPRKAGRPVGSTTKNKSKSKTKR